MKTNSTAFAHRYGPYALVTGASEGIGQAIAEELAQAGINVLLVARREDVLNKLAQRLESQYGVLCPVIAADLSKSEDIEKMFFITDQLDIGLVVCNAGFGTAGNFLDSDLAIEMNMLNEENNVSDDNCGICWENIYTYKKRFGLLSNCDHKFCIACIRKHRQNIQLPKINRNKCPLCRVPSFGYCSSKFFLTGVNKQNEFDKSSQNRAKIMCRNGFDCRKQYCGFKHSIL
jgi:hypothetical protein